MVNNDFPGIVGEDRQWYLIQRLNAVACHLFEIQTTPPHGDPAHLSACEPMLGVIMDGLAETFKTVIDDMTHVTNFNLANLMHAKNANHHKEYLNTRIDGPENQCNAHHVSYDSLTSRAKPLSNRRLCYCAWCVVSFDEFDRYKTQHSVG
jgi:hypothetical protein